MRPRDYYEVLGIDREATPEGIQSAFHALALKYHPDRNPGDPLAEERFKEISAAYEVLSHPGERARYDLEIGVARPRRPGPDGRTKEDSQSRDRAEQSWRTAPAGSTWGRRRAQRSEQEITEFVMRQLSRKAPRNDVILAVCRMGNLAWPRAEAFVRQVETTHGRAIANRQAPLLLAVSAATAAGGVMLILAYAYAVADLLLTGFPLPLLLLSVVQAPFLLWPPLIGLGMIAGGALGVWRTALSLRAEGQAD